MMNASSIPLEQIKKHVKAFILRWSLTASVLTMILLISQTSRIRKYGFSSTGEVHHSFLDYPNEIASADALELASFVRLLDLTWNNDKKVHQKYEKETKAYWEKEVDVQDRNKRSQIIQEIAKEMGLSAEKFPHVHHAITDTVKDKIHKHITFPQEYLKIKSNSKDRYTPQCDMTKLNHHRTTLIHFSSQQFQSTHIQVDGLFNDGGNINFRMATAAEAPLLQQNIRFNLTVYAQTDQLFDSVITTQTANEVSNTKNIHIHSKHFLQSCLVYNLEVIFPPSLKNYKSLDIKVNHAHQINGDLKSVLFENFVVGLGRGEIHFEHVKAKSILLGVLNGAVTGQYSPLHSLGAASVQGATNIEILPQSNYVKSTVVALNGPVKATVTDFGGKSKNGGFTVHCWLCEPSAISKLNPELVQFTSSRRSNIKIGYFQEKAGTHINVHSRQGESKLVYI